MYGGGGVVGILHLKIVLIASHPVPLSVWLTLIPRKVRTGQRQLLGKSPLKYEGIDPQPKLSSAKPLSSLIASDQRCTGRAEWCTAWAEWTRTGSRGLSLGYLDRVPSGPNSEAGGRDSAHCCWGWGWECEVL